MSTLHEQKHGAFVKTKPKHFILHDLLLTFVNCISANIQVIFLTFVRGFCTKNSM